MLVLQTKNNPRSWIIYSPRFSELQLLGFFTFHKSVDQNETMYDIP